MSTVAEIEAAVQALPKHEQQALLQRLTWHLSRREKKVPSQGWPVPPPDVPLEELQRIHAIIEAEFPQMKQ